jgi:hypothetical protein
MNLPRPIRLVSLLFSVTFSLIILGLAFMSSAQGQAIPSDLPPYHPAIEGDEIIDPAKIVYYQSPTSLISSTLNDFALPGTQPGMLQENIDSPEDCRLCHTDYAPTNENETWFAWRGSMMSQAARDPVFWAALDIANGDAAFSGDVCLRCHAPRGWLDGRVSSAPDGSQLNITDLEGVQCAVCHRMVDPIYSTENPIRDQTVLAAINPALTFFGNGAIVVDPLDERRGPFDLQEDWAINPHEPLPWPLVSPFHQDAEFCGSCHDGSNPLLEWDSNTQSYVLNALDAPASDVTTVFPVERTYSEWLLSDYNSETGIYAPQMGGNKSYVSTCQDCHMRDVTASAAEYWDGTQVIRDDMPLHDMTGGNTWVPLTLPLHPVFGGNFTGPSGQLRAQALISGTVRARYMLQNAATVQAYKVGDELFVTVVNETGHKLPTGYPEGRRMWLQVEGYDENGALVYTSGAYDANTGLIIADSALQVYEMKQGLTPDWAATLGLSAGESFHFILNNYTLKDNRIPPRGYEYDAFAAADAAPYTNGNPDPARYADGQYWDTTVYTLPANVAYGVVRLLYQTSSGEYINFLKDNNPNPAPNDNGQILYDLWEQTGRSTPEVMAFVPFGDTAFLPLINRK